MTWRLFFPDTVYIIFRQINVRISREMAGVLNLVRNACHCHLSIGVEILSCKDWAIVVGSVAQWLERQSMTGELFLACAMTCS